MRARLAQTDYADLWKGPRRTTTSRPSESPFVLRCIRHVQHETVDGHESHAGIEGVRGLRSCLQLDHVFRQSVERGNSQALSRHAKGRTTRRADAAVEPSQPPKNLPVIVTAE